MVRGAWTAAFGAVLVLALAGVARAQEFAGSWECPEWAMRLELEPPAGGIVRGVAIDTEDQSRSPFEGRLRDGKIYVKFTEEGETYWVRMELADPDTLRLRAADSEAGLEQPGEFEVVTFRRVGPRPGQGKQPPPAGPGAGPAAPPAPPPAAPGAPPAPGPAGQGPANPLGAGSAAARNPLAPPDPLEGRFAGERLRVELRGAAGAPAGSYEGRMELEGQAFPLKAQRQPDGTLRGSFEAGGASFEFDAVLEDGGRRLVLRTGGASYELRRESPPPPAPAPANPLAGGAGTPPAPAGAPSAGQPPAPAGPGQDPGAWAPPAPAGAAAAGKPPAPSPAAAGAPPAPGPAGQGPANPLGAGSAAARNPLAPPDPLEGRFAGERLRVELRGAAGAPAGSYEGRMELEGQAFPLKAQRQPDGTLRGSFEAGGASFEFDAVLEDGGRRLVLRTGGASYELRREAPPAPAPANPLAGGGAMPPGPPAPTGRDQEPAAGPPPGPPAPPVPAGPGQDPGAWAPPAPAPRGEPAPAAQAPGPWRDFAHPAGVLFSVPPGWTARLQAAGAQTVAVLVPPDLAVDADGDAMETYLVSTEALDPSARDIAPTDPRIQQGIAQGMSQQFPVPLRAQGPPERVAGKGYEAGRMRWTASSPDGSQLIVVECWVRVVEGKLVVVTGLGLAEQVARREPLVRRVMESIRPAPPGGVK